ncbi:hypothetical protein [Nocardioides sp.]|uniref:hypothetical protein n=1 Tax=Nocardioides sp. TaxID=35761 RepID=UPI0027374F50|nr:hypothetical protein [Nocardioides sp.]MDP3893530.1 hypothetical protein [Nocardioides sp.]
MSTEVIVYILTALAALVVVLTRVRLGGGRGAGRHHIGHGLLGLHTGAGVLALVVWLVFLLSPDDAVTGDALVGIVALGLWWIVVVVGLMVLLRWLPTRGRHASTGIEDSWSEGPGLSILAHVGMLVGVSVFTWAYLTSAV